ncbi:ester cyclase [Oscillibacter valericigenes]|uniref:ester cyclase n=1 Tax=Oscillibacter valericigenes TaxID=351091 RepID=UPI001F19B724|nr:ester cyclase [Oscillibacter valericigenes]MCF2616728.1 ester cyclase [Oscillibacter valericigenes]
MDDKELVSRFFTEGYEHQNFDFILECLAEDYLDHSPAGARSNRDAVGILKSVSGTFGDMHVTMEDIFSENGMVGTRVRYEAVHIGEWMGIAATGRRISFEALENFKVADGKIVESWGYWPDKEIERLLKE